MIKKSDDYILFIDESGKSKFSDQGDHFLLCGLIINKDLHSALSSYMVSLKEKSDIPSGENVHAFDLFESENVKGAHHKHSHINTFFKRLCTLVQGADIQCLIVRVKKNEYKKIIEKKAKKLKISERTITNLLKKSTLHDILYEALARKLILEFGHFLEKENAYGEVVAESRRQDDDAMLRAFIDSTQDSRFREGTTFALWSKYSFKRIHSLIFQNKKGLSFGLEVADLFAWAHFNAHYGKLRSFPSAAKNKRVDDRLKKVTLIMKETLMKNKIEDMSPTKLRNVAGDRVSKFTELLDGLKASQ